MSSENKNSNLLIDFMANLFVSLLSGVVSGGLIFFLCLRVIKVAGNDTSTLILTLTGFIIGASYGFSYAVKRQNKHRSHSK